MIMNPTVGMQTDQAVRAVNAYFLYKPDFSDVTQKIVFGTSGHRGSSLKSSFNEWHIVAITQAVCDYRKYNNICGPLFIGMDTNTLSTPAYQSAIEVFAANGVDIMIAAEGEFTPTPFISHAIVRYNFRRQAALADGLIISASHEPPSEGGIKYSATHGGPAAPETTAWITERANWLLHDGINNVRRVLYEQALLASTTHYYDYQSAYINDLGNVIDMAIIRDENLRVGIDTQGGACVHYWERIAERYGLRFSLVNTTVDPTFGIMALDRDGQIKLDPSSPFAVNSLVNLKRYFDVAFACDPDHERHGIVTPSKGLMPSDQYLAIALFYLCQHRPKWNETAAIGKSVVGRQMIERVCNHFGRKIYEVPLGFNWFSHALIDGSLAFASEESASMSFARMDGSAWITDKDGITAALLAAEMTARLGGDLSSLYKELERDFGEGFYSCNTYSAKFEQKKMLVQLTPQHVHLSHLGGEQVQSVYNDARGNDESIEGLKAVAENGWFAVLPSGINNLYKIHAESFRGEDHLGLIQQEAKSIVESTLARVIRGDGEVDGTK